MIVKPRNQKILAMIMLCFLCFFMGGCGAGSTDPTATTSTSGSSVSSGSNTTSSGNANTTVSGDQGKPKPDKGEGPAMPGLDGDKAGTVVVVDPGHPSEVNDAKTVQNGTTELKMNWEVGMRLAALISQDPALRCVKTHEVMDEMTTNRRRAEIANEAGAAVMVRLHCDTGGGSGFTVYYPDRQGTAQGVTGPSQDVIDGSRLAAQCIQDGLSQALQGKLAANPVKGDSATAIGSKQGALTGSIFSKVPAVTVEMVFLNNGSDAEFIKSAEGQDLLAKGLYEGIRKYLKTKQ